LLTSDAFGNLTIQFELEGIENDFQLWLINPKTGLIQNKRTGMYLKTDFDGNVRTFEDLRNDFNKWKPLLPNITLSGPSIIINSPFGKINLDQSTSSFLL
jgi:hypothetical protein